MTQKSKCHNAKMVPYLKAKGFENLNNACSECGKICDLAPEPIKCSFCGDDKYTEGIDQEDIHACKKCCIKMGMSGEPAQNTPEIVHNSDDMLKECADWEEEFDKRFVEVDIRNGEKTAYYFRGYEENEPILYKHIKSFISSLLSAKDAQWQKIVYGERQMYERGKKDGRQEAIEECIKSLPEEKEGESGIYTIGGWNIAIRESKSNLLKLKLK